MCHKIKSFGELMMFYNLVHLGARPDDHCKCVLSMKTVTAFKESYLKKSLFCGVLYYFENRKGLLRRQMSKIIIVYNYN